MAIVWAVLVLPGSALGQSHGPCTPPIHEWAEGCSEDEDVDVAALFCDGENVVVLVGSLRVDLREQSEGAFRDVNGVGVSPVGDFPDWSAAGERPHAELAAIERCVERSTPFAIEERGVDAFDETSPRARGAPTLFEGWRLWIGLLLLAGLLARGRSKGELAALAALGVGTFLLRNALHPGAFFHENGHGPAWVEFALCWPSDYGPGYREVLGAFAAMGGGAPEETLFTAMGALTATGPVLAYLIASNLGAGRSLSAATASLLVFDPILGRIARSESYDALGSWLLLAATAALTAPSIGLRKRHLLFGYLAAGLLIAQAARIHPLCWIPAALLPLVALAKPGERGIRVGDALSGALFIGFCVTLFAGSTMQTTLEGHLGREWLGPAAALELAYTPFLHLFWLVPLVLTLTKERARAITAIVALVIVVFVATTIEGLAPWFGAALEGHRRLFLAALLGPVIGVVVCVAHSARRRSIAAALILTAGLVVSLLQRDAWTTFPTDTQEQTFALEWRERLPADARVAYLARLHEHSIALPIYECVPQHPRAIRLRSEDPDRALLLRHATHYYESSLCANNEARPVCEALAPENAVLVEENRFPARRSALQVRYHEDPVHVRLLSLPKSSN